MGEKRIGVGLCTHQRTQYALDAIASIEEHLTGIIDVLVVSDDGPSQPGHITPITAALEASDIFSVRTFRSTNCGVASSKNFCLSCMYDLECDYMFLMEDDMIITNPKAVTEYIRVSKETGLEHMNFAKHGYANMISGKFTDDVLDEPPPPGVEIWPNCVGAWSFYTRNAIETVGYMDEGFYNAWEHCEHTARIGKVGLTMPFWRFPDVVGSEQWIVAQPGAEESSTIRNNPDWQMNMEQGKAYWESIDPEIWSE